ncbi:unnamed protein product, partial [Rotaria sp. Silwood1]
DVLRQDDFPQYGENHLMTVLALIYFVIFVLVNVVVAVLMKKLDESNRIISSVRVALSTISESEDDLIQYCQHFCSNNLLFKKRTYLKDFLHGRSVDEEGEQQDTDDDLFDKKEHINENAESTDEEIHPEKEKDLLWLTREGLMKPLSLGWKACQEENEEFYYYYFNTEKSSWDRPYDDIYKTHVIQARGSNGTDRKENESTAVITPYPPMSFTINTGTTSTIRLEHLVQEQEERKLRNKMKVDLTLIENNIRENLLHENKSLENRQQNELNNIEETIEREKQELQKKLNYLNLEQQNNTNIQIRLLQMKHEFDEKLHNVKNLYKNEIEDLTRCYKQITVKNDTLEKRLTQSSSENFETFTTDGSRCVESLERKLQDAQPELKTIDDSNKLIQSSSTRKSLSNRIHDDDDDDEELSDTDNPSWKGKLNTNEILHEEPRFISSLPNGKRFVVGQDYDKINIIHLVAKWIAEYGLPGALDLNYDIARKYTPPWYDEELQGLAAGSGVLYKDSRRLNLLPELINAA